MKKLKGRTVIDKIGIDKIAFYVPKYFLDVKILAKERNVDENKFLDGIGQKKMSVLPPNEDIVTMALNACDKILDNNDKKDIELVIFCTESGIDQSKSAGIYINSFLGLNQNCRVIELKQACYSSTAGLMLAINYIKNNKDKKVLIIASDNARYGLNTAGEITQGCGAIAMTICNNPSVMSINMASGYYTEDVMDFWRPNYMDEALVDGKYSTKIYLKALIKTWESYKNKNNITLSDHYKICFHTPFCKLTKKALEHLQNCENIIFDNSIDKIIEYNKSIGNCYTASLYISICSLLDNIDDLENKLIGMYAFGSGCVAEFFSGIVKSGYKSNIFTKLNQEMLNNRIELSYSEYENFYNFIKNTRFESDVEIFKIDNLYRPKYELMEIKNNKRIYIISNN